MQHTGVKLAVIVQMSNWRPKQTSSFTNYAANCGRNRYAVSQPNPPRISFRSLTANTHKDSSAFFLAARKISQKSLLRTKFTANIRHWIEIVECQHIADASDIGHAILSVHRAVADTDRSTTYRRRRRLNARSQHTNWTELQFALFC